MSTSRTLLFACAFLSCSSPLIAQAPAALARFQFLVGEWEATGSGSPGEGGGRYTFSPDLQGRVLVRRSFAAYPATADRPAYRHDDLMIVFVDGETARADYYDSEGHVIRYAVDSPEPGLAVFVSDVNPSAPRYRLTYARAADETVAGRFEIAPPGQPEAFKLYLTWISRRVSRPAGAGR
jgi:hypothetical protein